MMKIINFILILSIVYANSSFEFPQHSNNLARWNGGSAISSNFQQLNPASLAKENHFSVSIIQLPENISYQNYFISKVINNNLIKINSSILNYGNLEDYITKKSFSANDFSIGFSLKSEFEKLISIGIQFNYLNSKIENYDNKILRSGIGIKTRLLNKRLGIGIAFHKIIFGTDSVNSIDKILGVYYKPMYFSGEIALDFIKKEKFYGIISLQMHINNYISTTIGMTTEKFDYHTGSNLQNIFYGLSSGVQFKLKKYKLDLGFRNIGQFGNMSGLSLGYSF